jgi:hypothetical protein
LEVEVKAILPLLLIAGSRTMVETAVYFDDDGKPVMRTNHFTRVR